VKQTTTLLLPTLNEIEAVRVIVPQLRRDWVDRVGAFWLVGCAFGPLLGWLVTETFPITPDSWHWLYGLRALLAAGVPLVLALPLLRYVRGKSSLVALPLLVVITLLPVSTAIPVIQDLWEGPCVRQAPSTSEPEFYLKRTEPVSEVYPFERCDLSLNSEP